MKAVHVCILISMVIFICACVTGGPGGAGKEKILYETDFSSDDGALLLTGGRKAEIADGVLRLTGGAEDGPAWAGIKIQYGNNSRTTFRIQFGDPVFAHINFLTQEELKARFLVHVMGDNVCCHSIANREDLSTSGFEVSLVPGRWYEFSFTIEDYLLTLFIDGEKAGAAAIDRRIPGEGWLTFECHEEYRVDDLRILELPKAGAEGESERFSMVEQEDIRALLLRWEEAVDTQDSAMFESVLWPDIFLEFHDRQGRRTDLQGIEAVRRFRLDVFGERWGPREYRLPEPENFEDNGQFDKCYGFDLGTGIHEWLCPRFRDGRWRIHHIELRMPVPGSWVANRWQALGDESGDGFLQDEEQKQLFEWTQAFFSGPRTVENPVDELFDGDEDGKLTAREIGEAEYALFNRSFRWLRDFAPGWASGWFDLDGSGDVSDDELNRIYRFVTGDETEAGEIGRERGHFFAAAINTPFPDALSQPVPREISSYIDELADGDGDGMIDQAEQDIILSSLTSHHPVSNYFEQSIDLNHDGRIGSSDVLLTLQAAAGGKRILSSAGEPPYPVVTILDQYLDENGDGSVDADEIYAVVAFFSGDRSADISRRLQNLSDWNDDGQIDRDDLERAAGFIVYPHPVNPDDPLDVSGDSNGDGYIAPAELGITGGVTAKGAVPTLADRIRLVRGKASVASGDGSPGGSTGDGFQSEYYRRLGTIQDRKLAVISLDTQTVRVDDETAMGIIVFVENAFVNVGKVRVVERNNIEELLKEYEFQSSALIDENTAIEIGKLSGADIIVIGSINRVGGVYYLNIKLIDVKTGEIIGSNIARARDESEFLDMCNEAVYMLF